MKIVLPLFFVLLGFQAFAYVPMLQESHYWRSLEGAGVSPLHADLSGVASMTIVLAECDPVHDEGAAFARRLDEAAVPVEVLDYSGMFHPFILFRGLDTTRRAERDVAAALRRHLLD